ncbi:hypothetical protein [Dawidia soli]|uniref:Uncharacterized protein n=1 Tax=Dawidia soli TaxID=2782352 RepID=A0AAP2GCI2_9BACT|nr:hypothetical protein [Dawidia soli]MBT1686182.1 hypothetical protein [Dawidia soli]
MKVVVYLPSKVVKEVTSDEHAKIGELIKIASPNTVGLDDNLEDQEVYLLDEPEELSKDAKVKERKAFVIHRCRKVRVSIIYAGKVFSGDYPPSKLIKHVRKDAIEGLCIDGPAGNNLELYETEDQNSKVNRNYPVGYFSDYPVCGIKFYLADPNAFAG